MKKNLLLIDDLSKEEIETIIKHALKFKSLQANGIKQHNFLQDKFFLLLFEKPSTRTRISFEVAIKHLGGNYTTLNYMETQLSRGEPIKDFARVVSRYVDGIIARVKKHETLEELSRYSTVPIINALSDKEHPVQVLADLMTIFEKKGKIKDLNIAFVGDGQDNVLNSLIIASSLMGLNLYIASPKELWPDPTYINKAKEYSKNSGSNLILTTDPVEAVIEADVIYTDVWISMGKEDEAQWRRKILNPYQVNKELLSKAYKKPIVMHCLPAFRGEEITDDVIESEQSVIFEQAENRLHLQKGLLYYLFYELIP